MDEQVPTASNSQVFSAGSESLQLPQGPSVVVQQVGVPQSVDQVLGQAGQALENTSNELQPGAGPISKPVNFNVSVSSAFLLPDYQMQTKLTLCVSLFSKVPRLVGVCLCQSLCQPYRPQPLLFSMFLTLAVSWRLSGWTRWPVCRVFLMYVSCLE